MPPDLNFSEALMHLMSGYRMAARFMPDSIYIELQKPDEGSMNTEPYLKMVTVNEKGVIQKCEPWEPGRRSIFSTEWYTSKWQGVGGAQEQ